jgi:hypothetical protein
MIARCRRRFEPRTSLFQSRSDTYVAGTFSKTAFDADDDDDFDNKKYNNKSCGCNKIIGNRLRRKGNQILE